MVPEDRPDELSWSLDPRPPVALSCRRTHPSGVAPRFNLAGGVIDCHQQYAVGPYTLENGGIHQMTRRYTRDRRCDAWLREHGGLMFRVDIENRALLPSQIRRVLDVVRAMAPHMSRGLGRLTPGEA